VLTGMAEMVTRSLEKDWVAKQRRESAKLLLAADLKVRVRRAAMAPGTSLVRCAFMHRTGGTAAVVLAEDRRSSAARRSRLPRENCHLPLLPWREILRLCTQAHQRHLLSTPAPPCSGRSHSGCALIASAAGTGF